VWGAAYNIPSTTLIGGIISPNPAYDMAATMGANLGLTVFGSLRDNSVRTAANGAYVYPARIQPGQSVKQSYQPAHNWTYLFYTYGLLTGVTTLSKFDAVTTQARFLELARSIASATGPLCYLLNTQAGVYEWTQAGGAYNNTRARWLTWMDAFASAFKDVDIPENPFGAVLPSHIFSKQALYGRNTISLYGGNSVGFHYSHFHPTATIAKSREYAINASSDREFKTNTFTVDVRQETYFSNTHIIENRKIKYDPTDIATMMYAQASGGHDFFIGSGTVHVTGLQMYSPYVTVATSNQSQPYWGGPAARYTNNRVDRVASSFAYVMTMWMVGIYTMDHYSQLPVGLVRAVNFYDQLVTGKLHGLSTLTNNEDSTLAVAALDTSFEAEIDEIKPVVAAYKATQKTTTITTPESEKGSGPGTSG
jgi:hypothetical protein